MVRSMVSSDVDDGAMAAATNSTNETKRLLSDTFQECNRIANMRGMNFSSRKIEWIGMGKDDWGKLRVKEEKDKRMVEEIRILGYRVDKDGKMRGHVEYWTERGVGVKGRIAGLSRRFGSEGGLKTSECLRLIQGAYLLTVCYRLEFVNHDKKLTKMIQTFMNDTIRSTFRAPLKITTNILCAETGIAPIKIMGRLAERRGYARHLKYEYGKECLWFGWIANRWKDKRLLKPIMVWDKVMITKPVFVLIEDKQKAKKLHDKRWKNGLGDSGVAVYTDRSKSEGEVSMSWVRMGGEEMVEEELGVRVPESWNILKAELGGIRMAVRDMRRHGGKKLTVFSDSLVGLRMIKEMESEGESASLWDRLVPAMNEWEEVEMV